MTQMTHAPMRLDTGCKPGDNVTQVTQANLAC